MIRVKVIILHVSLIEDIYYKCLTVVSTYRLLVNEVFFFSSKKVKIN